MWALGYDGGRTELYRALADSFLVDKSAPQAGITALRGQPGRRGLHRHVGRQATPARSPRTTSRSRPTAAPWRTWLLADEGDLRRLARAARARATRSASGRATRKGNAGRVERRRRPGTPRPSLATGGFGRVVRRRARLPRAARARRDAARHARRGHDRRDHARPGRRRRLHLVRGHPADPRVDARSSFVERGVWIAVARSSTPTYVVAVPGAQQHDASTPGSGGLDFGASGAATALGTSARPARGPRVLAQRRRLRGRHPAALDERRRAMDSLVAARPPARRQRWSGTRTSVPARAGGQAWDWNGTVGGRRVARRALRAPARRDGRRPDLPRALGAARDAGPGRRATPSRVDTASPDGDLGVRHRPGDLAQRRRRTATDAAGARGDGRRRRWTVRSPTPPAPRSGRSRAPARSVDVHLERDRRRAARRVADGRYTRSPSRSSTPPATRRAHDRDDRRRHDGARRSPPRATPRAFSPERRRRRRHDVPLVDGATSARPAACKLFKGSTLIRTWTVDRTSPPGRRPGTARRADGPRVADGTYTLKVDVKDAGRQPARGVARRSSSTGRPGASRWSGDLSSQDGDALKPTSTPRLAAARDAKTTLRRLRRRRARSCGPRGRGRAQGAGTRGWTWNGRRDDGSLVAAGPLPRALTVTSPLGTLELRAGGCGRPRSRSPRRRTVVKAGQTLVVRFRSVEPLSTKPRVTFTPARPRRPSP